LKIKDRGRERGCILILSQNKVGRHLSPEEILRGIREKFGQIFTGCSFELVPGKDIEIFYTDDLKLVGNCFEHGDMDFYPFCGKCGKPTRIVPK
jgi:hypothetical protein